MRYIGSLMYDDLLKKKQIIVFGCGDMLESLINELNTIGIIKQVVAICDNDTKKQGKEIYNIPIMSFTSAFNLYKDAEIIVYNKYKKEIAEYIIEYTDKIHYISL